MKDISWDAEAFKDVLTDIGIATNVIQSIASRVRY